MGEENMDRPKFSNTITFGNLASLLPLAVIIGGGLIAWGSFNGKMVDLERRIAPIEAQIANVPVIMSRVSNIEGQMAATLERLGASLATVSERQDRTNSGLADIKTEIAVVRQRLDHMSPEQRTELGRRLVSSQGDNITDTP